MPATVNSTVGVVRDQAGRRHDRVVALGEEAGEGAAELVGVRVIAAMVDAAYRRRETADPAVRRW